MRACILYGVFEGSGHGRLLRKELKKMGLGITKKSISADIIIAHSGGGFMLPEVTTAKIILLVGLPHWPGKTITTRMFHKVIADPKDFSWAKKSLLNIFYAFVKPIYWYKMQRAMRRGILSYDDTPVIAIRNHNDKFIDESTFEDLVSEHGWVLHELSGYHDDIWINPKPYVNIIKKYI